MSKLSAKQARSHVRLIGYISAAFVVLTASTSASFAKQLTEALSPLSLLLVSESMALIFALLSFGLISLVDEFRKCTYRHYLPIVLVAITSSIIAPLLIFSGIHMTQAANAELFLRSDMLFLFIFGVIFLNETIERRHLFAGLTIIFGIVIVAFQGFTHFTAPLLGDLLIIAAAITYGIGGILFKKFLSDLHPEMVIVSRSLIVILFYIFALSLTEPVVVQEVSAFPVALIGVLLGYGFFARFLNLFSFYETMEHLPVHTVSLILPLSTVGSLFFAHLYLGEVIEWYHIAGGLCIMLGSMLMQFHTEHLKEPEHLDRHMRHHHRRHV